MKNKEIQDLKESQVVIRRLKKELEQKNRELKIESGLERVRTRAMAMKNSEELADLVATVFNELVHLGFVLTRCYIYIIDPDSLSLRAWTFNTEIGQLPESYHIKYLDLPYYKALINAWKAKKPKFVYELGGAEKKEVDRILFNETEYSRLPEGVKTGMASVDRVFLSYSFNNFGGLQTGGLERLSNDQMDILYRFGKVFDLTFTRFSDLKQAEAQAREAQIEAAMERVRARTMAMRKSEELFEVVNHLYAQIEPFGISTLGISLAIFLEEEDALEYWYSDHLHSNLVKSYKVRGRKHPVYQKIWKGWKNNQPFLKIYLEGDKKREYDDYILKETDFIHLPEELKNDMYNFKVVHFTYSFMKYGIFEAVDLAEPVEENVGLLIRFSKVFEQAYTRFLDLQKAEAQAREAEIQLALERVRARIMSMHHSNELPQVTFEMFEQMNHLGFAEWGVSISLVNEEKAGLESWYSTPDERIATAHYFFPSHGHPIAEKMWNVYKEQIALSIIELRDGEKLEYTQWALNNTELRNLPEKDKALILAKPYVMIASSASKHGFLQTYSHEPMTQELTGILPRFAKIFDQAYTRFLDLQKAEAQAREAGIQLALERVRARAMAMKSSEELAEVSFLLNKQVVELGIPTVGCAFNIYGENESTEWWSSLLGTVSAYKTPRKRFFLKYYEAGQRGETLFIHELTGKEIKEAYTYLLTLPAYSEFAQSSSWEGIPDTQINHVAYFSYGYLLFITLAPAPEAYDVFKRFAKEFEQTYTRFLDLQKAEKQAREAQIEAALEKVRSRSLAMHKADELGEVAMVVFEKLRELNIPVNDGVAIVSHIEGSKDQIEWMESPGYASALKVYVAYFDHPILADYWKAKNEGVDFIAPRYTAEENKSFLNHVFEYSDFKHTPQEIKDYCLAAKTYSYSAAFQKNSSIFINDYSGRSLSEQEIDIVKRFSKVFEQAYTRFLDLQKAEAQAREAQIEAALERVRSRSMGMQKSEELKEVIQVVYEQFIHLKINVDHAGFVVDYKPRGDWHFWIADKQQIPSKITHPYFDSVWANQFDEAKEKGIDFFATNLNFEEKNRFYQDLFRYIPGLSEQSKEFYFNCPGLAASNALLEHVALYIENFSAIPYTDEENKILMRFGKVFQQTYTRFLDLQKAEEQAREAQIEAALEKVRSRTMAMQQSGEIADIAGKIFGELRQLDLVLNRVLIWIFNDEERFISWWSANPEVENNVESYRIDYNDQPVFQSYLHAWQKRTPLHLYTLSGDTKKKWEDHLFANTELSKLPMEVRKGMREEGSIFTTSTISDYGLMMAGSFEPLSEKNVDIIQRFGRVFQQSYTRFLDVQKAEEQARESMIEAALERVRAKTMAMHRSEELADTASVLFNELKKLGIESIRSGVGIIDYENDTAELWLVTETDGKAERKILGKINASIHPLYQKWFDAGRKNMPYYVKEMEGEELKNYYETVSRYWQLPIPSEFNHKEVYHGFFFPEGTINVISLKRLPEAECNTVLRFAKVFGLLYRRFLDLQKAESQAREAVKQASIDRVRGEIASMRTSNDLERITPLIWAELINLDVPFIRCGVFIMDEDQRIIHNYLSTPDGKAIAAFHLPYGTPGFVTKVLSHWQKKKMYLEHWDKKAMTDFAHVLVKQGIFSSPDHYLNALPKKGFHLHLLPFQQGMLYVGNLTQLESEELDLLQSLANAFSTAYARYDDFNKLELAKKQVDKALVDLKQAQQQLVQSEKMASLGELTAGIAHEIQNPLNFVNNFSEVNDELVEELLEEIKKGDLEEVRLIANDIRENEQKIRHHGKRAEGIVKGMLQHSRSSSGQKELTDVNSLCDEYLRLAYHGFRAKDKSFNANFKINLDENLPKIEINAQDIGRVILNLINNAFYTVSQKSKENVEKYAPEVVVSTMKQGEMIEIGVKDNGGGIPKSVLDKIFQPFFTTKPTGEGTGLGLSISYDIITKGHGGQLNVETLEGEGTEFKIILPIN